MGAYGSIGAGGSVVVADDAHGRIGTGDGGCVGRGACGFEALYRRACGFEAVPAASTKRADGGRVVRHVGPAAAAATR
jgi:hypothetical protein